MPALLFDLDGTLVDSDPVHYAVMEEIFGERGITIDPAFYEAEIHGLQNQVLFRKHLPDEDADWLSDHKEARFRERLGTKATPTTGAPELVARAQDADWPIAVVTNGCVENAEHMLHAIGLRDAFKVVVHGSEGLTPKPDPTPYRTGLARLGVTAAEAIAFEDSPTGITSAIGAGVRTIGMTSSLSTAALKDLGTIGAIADFTDPSLDRFLSDPEGALP